ncbi:MAG: hypothetical protein P8046_02155 [Anaerolineales bacterium]
MTQPQSVPKKRGWQSLKAREVRLAWWLISPTALIVFGLVLFPAVFSIWISFHKVGLYNLNDVFNAPFNGWDNFRSVLSDFVCCPGHQRCLRVALAAGPASFRCTQ